MRIGFYVQVFESLGVEYLSASLKQAGHETELFYDPALCDDIIAEKQWLSRLLSIEDLLVERMASSGIELAAFTVTTDTFARALRVAAKLKRISGIPTVFGGIHATSAPERVMEHQEIDYAIMGEGEQALVDLADALQERRPAASIENLCFRQNGNLAINPVRHLVEDLDTLPFPDKALFWDCPTALHTNRYTIMTSRGCAFSCTYCCNSYLRPLYRGKGHWLRRRSVDNAITELVAAKSRFSFNRVQFWDDNFVGDAAWLEEFADKYPKAVGIPFFAWVNPKLADKSTVALLEKAGCGEINIGVQTVHETTRRRYLRRRDTNAEIKDILDAARGTNMFVSTDNILQLPGQTLDEALDLARFYADNPVDLPYAFIFRAYPRTRIVKMLQEESGAEYSKACMETAMSGRSNSVMHSGDQTDLMKVRTLILLTSLLPRSALLFLLRNARYKYLPMSKTSTLLTVLCGLQRRLFSKKRHMPCGFKLSEYACHWLRFAILGVIWRSRWMMERRAFPADGLKNGVSGK